MLRAIYCIVGFFSAGLKFAEFSLLQILKSHLGAYLVSEILAESYI